MKQMQLLQYCCYTLHFSCSSKTFFVFGGKTGWIGQQIMHHVTDQGHTAIAAESRLRKQMFH